MGVLLLYEVKGSCAVHGSGLLLGGVGIHLPETLACSCFYLVGYEGFGPRGGCLGLDRWLILLDPYCQAVQGMFCTSFCSWFMVIIEISLTNRVLPFFYSTLGLWGPLPA